MKKSCKRLSSLLIIMLMEVVYLMSGLPVKPVQASETSEDLARTNLNVICKYLYLGNADKSKFDFNIKKEALEEGAAYRWYVVTDKGNPKAISIDSDSGMVSAKKAGIAYIICEIKQADNTVVKPEAKVVVINNITKVGISNLPENLAAVTGSALDFNETILMTSAGKIVETSGIVRWEIANDTTGAGEITEKGVVVPKKAGEFSIRAVCFQSIEDYQFWLTNKAAHSDLITAASDWAKIKVLSSEGEVATQEQLDEMLTSKTIKRITLMAERKTEITIPEGNYTDKTLIINKSEAKTINYGNFKMIIIKSALDTIWEENAADNSFEIYDSKIKMLVNQKSQVKSIKLGTESSKADNLLVNTSDITINGKLTEVDVTASSKLILSGNGAVSLIKIEENTHESQVVTSVKVDFTINADSTIVLLPGAEKSKIDFLKIGNLRVENFTESNLDLNYYSVNYFHAYIQIPKDTGVLITSGSESSLGFLKESSIVKLTPKVATTIIASSVIQGNALINASLRGDFIYKTTPVSGKLSWVDPFTVVNSTRYYDWIFIPNDQSHYNIVYGSALVEAKDISASNK